MKILKNIIQIKHEYQKISIAFDDMIADIPNEKGLNPIVTELFIRGIKLNISIAFIQQFHFAVPKNIRLNCTHYFITKTSSKREFQKNWI